MIWVHDHDHDSGVTHTSVIFGPLCSNGPHHHQVAAMCQVAASVCQLSASGVPMARMYTIVTCIYVCMYVRMHASTFEICMYVLRSSNSNSNSLMI